MTAQRAKIEASLAERGRPVDWANEQETAALCGVPYDKYRKNLADMEARGFPKVFAFNGLRFIPFIKAYLLRELDAAQKAPAESPAADETHLETFGAPRKRA